MGFQETGVVDCASGQRFAGMVIVAAGAEPAVDWLRGSGLVIDDGIGADAYCEVAPNIFVAGDVARWPSARFGCSLRIEPQMNAVEQATVAARNVLGQSQRYDPLPFFWSDQYDVKIQVHGLIESDSATRMLHGDKRCGAVRRGLLQPRPIPCAARSDGTRHARRESCAMC